MVTDEIRRDSDDIIRKKYIRTITFDFSGTAFMDSSGIGLIMGRYRMMGMRGDCIQATGVIPILKSCCICQGYINLSKSVGKSKRGEENYYGKYQ